MPQRRKLTPSYLEYKQSGKARAVWTDSTGERHQKLLPGSFNSTESRTAFARLQLEMEAAPHHVQNAQHKGLMLTQMLVAYLEHAERHYCGSSEIVEVKIVVRALRELYGEKPVAEFGPLCVKAARQQWINENRSRTECNRRLGLIKRICNGLCRRN